MLQGRGTTLAIDDRTRETWAKLVVLSSITDPDNNVRDILHEVLRVALDRTRERARKKTGHEAVAKAESGALAWWLNSKANAGRTSAARRAKRVEALDLARPNGVHARDAREHRE